jgi:hypothetical protein
MPGRKGELYRRVHEVLFYIWDPIGVSDEPCARGEYRGYVPQIHRLLETTDDAAAISARLAEIMTAHMELGPDRELCDRTADLLLGHKYPVREGLA